MKDKEPHSGLLSFSFPFFHIESFSFIILHHLHLDLDPFYGRFVLMISRAGDIEKRGGGSRLRSKSKYLKEKHFRQQVAPKVIFLSSLIILSLLI